MPISFVLVKLNAVKLSDKEALQQDNSATSAMRVKRSFDCLLSKGSEPFQVKLRAAGPASVVNVLWQVAMDAAHVAAVTTYFFSLVAAEMETDRMHLTFDTRWTPVKRLHPMRDSMRHALRWLELERC